MDAHGINQKQKYDDILLKRHQVAFKLLSEIDLSTANVLATFPVSIDVRFVKLVSGSNTCIVPPAAVVDAMVGKSSAVRAMVFLMWNKGARLA